jgi:hypothetical protein
LWKALVFPEKFKIIVDQYGSYYHSPYQNSTTVTINIRTAEIRSSRHSVLKNMYGIFPKLSLKGIVFSLGVSMP